MSHPFAKTSNIQFHFARKNQKFSKVLKKNLECPFQNQNDQNVCMVSFATVVLYARECAHSRVYGCVQTNIATITHLNVEVVTMNEHLERICGSEKNTFELKHTPDNIGENAFECGNSHHEKSIWNAFLEVEKCISSRHKLNNI